MKKAVLFDIDGTILDSAEFVFGALRYALTIHGYPYPSPKMLQKAQGKALDEFYQTLFPKLDISKFKNTHLEFQKKHFHLVKPFPNSIKVLKALQVKKIVLAAISNRRRDSLLTSLERAGIFDLFDMVVSAEDVVNPKPHQEAVLFALKKLEVSPQNSYMIGDTEHDILAGKNAKVKTVGVTYGWLGKDIKKLKPDFVIDDIEQVLDIITT